MVDLEKKWLNSEENLAGWKIPVGTENIEGRVADTLEPEEYRVVRKVMDAVSDSLNFNFSSADKELICEKIGKVDLKNDGERIGYAIDTFYEIRAKKFWRDVISKWLEEWAIPNGQGAPIPFDFICGYFRVQYPKADLDVLQLPEKLQNIIRDVYQSELNK